MANNCGRSAEPLRKSVRFTNNDENTETVPPNTVNVTVAGAGLDTFIPTIPEVRTADITAKFKIKMLPPIK